MVVNKNNDLKVGSGKIFRVLKKPFTSKKYFQDNDEPSDYIYNEYIKKNINDTAYIKLLSFLEKDGDLKKLLKNINEAFKTYPTIMAEIIKHFSSTKNFFINKIDLDKINNQPQNGTNNQPQNGTNNQPQNRTNNQSQNGTNNNSADETEIQYENNMIYAIVILIHIFFNKDSINTIETMDDKKYLNFLEPLIYNLNNIDCIMKQKNKDNNNNNDIYRYCKKTKYDKFEGFFKILYNLFKCDKKNEQLIYFKHIEKKGGVKFVESLFKYYNKYPKAYKLVQTNGISDEENEQEQNEQEQNEQEQNEQEQNGGGLLNSFNNLKNYYNASTSFTNDRTYNLYVMFWQIQHIFYVLKPYNKVLISKEDRKNIESAEKKVKYFKKNGNFKNFRLAEIEIIYNKICIIINQIIKKLTDKSINKNINNLTILNNLEALKKTLKEIIAKLKTEEKKKIKEGGSYNKKSSKKIANKIIKQS